MVRDKIPAIIEGRGERADVVQLSGDALTSALRQKLVEEALEALDAKSGDDLVGELADLEEVIAGLRHALRLTKAQIEAERIDKHERRGGFQKGYMLTRTSTPHSLLRAPAIVGPTLGLESKGPRNIVISHPANIPSVQTYRRPDLRQVEREIEKLFVFESEIKSVTNVTETVNFALPIDDGQARDFTLTVEITRKRSALRTSVRLRLRPSQLTIDFSGSQLQFEFRKQ